MRESWQSLFLMSGIGIGVVRLARLNLSITIDSTVWRHLQQMWVLLTPDDGHEAALEATWNLYLLKKEKG